VKPSAAAQPLPGKIAARLREAKWLALIAVATYLALVLATYDRADPGWSHSPVVDRVHNAGGRAGAWLADLALYVFGVSAWWWVVLLVYAVMASQYESLRDPFIIMFSIPTASIRRSSARKRAASASSPGKRSLATAAAPRSSVPR